MLGNRCEVLRVDGSCCHGTLLEQDQAGVVVYKDQGLAYERVFIPYTQIIEIRDMGPVYR